MARKPFLVLLSLVFGLVLVRAVTVRMPESERSGPPPLAPEADTTGAIVIDVVDDAARGELAELGQRVDRAIAPFEWADEEAALGTALYEPAALYRITPPPSEVADVLSALERHPDIESVEIEREWRLPGIPPVALGEANADELDTHRAEPPAPDADADVAPSDDAARGPFKPNDPYYKYQWHLDQIGMPAAWARSQGEGAVVAVVDTGVLFRDKSRFKRAPDLIETRFVPGWDFIELDASPDDEHGHGTHVAGTVAQSTNNALGVAGVAPRAAIMPIRVLDRRGAGGFGGVAAGIRWAADHGANIINLSLGGGFPSPAVRRAVDHAHKKGVLVVAAAGNSGRSAASYPAAHANVLAVGAVRFDRELTFYSNYGRGLDLVAPGGDLRVDQNNDGKPDGVIQNTMLRGDPSRHDYLAWQGTSMAAPHVAGVAALLYANGITDPQALSRILTGSAESIGPKERFGAGLVQASAALAAAEEGTALARGLSVLLLAGLVIFGASRRRRLDVRVGSTLSIAFVLAGGAAIAAAWLPMSVVQVVRGPFVWAAAELGPWGALVTMTALLPLGLIALLWGVRAARPFLVGTALAGAATFAVEALMPSLHFALIPELFLGPWLLLQAGLLIVVARVLVTRPLGLE